jgi:rare lipoprotein A
MAKTLLVFLVLFLFPCTANARCGKASWYHEGTRTATGERYNPDGLTAAHRTLKFGTRVTVQNIRNGKTVNVRINDRGPARWTGREIDLSRGAFRAIAGLGAGVVYVCF